MIINTVEEFCTHFKHNQPLLCIDYGQKKVGFAISTPDYKMSLPLDLLIIESQKKKIAKILEIIKEKNICAVVVGLPLNMDGSKSLQTLVVEEFTKKLEARIKLPIFFQDERLTSRAADSFLKMFDLNRRSRNKNDDLAAASMILETTLQIIAKTK